MVAAVSVAAAVPAVHAERFLAEQVATSAPWTRGIFYRIDKNAWVTWYGATKGDDLWEWATLTDDYPDDTRLRSFDAIAHAAFQRAGCL